MRNSTRRGLMLLAMATGAAFMTGCAGTRFSFDDARRVKVGMTTKELQDIMGRPYRITTRGDSEIWVWSQANGLTGSHSAVSFSVKDGIVTSVPKIPDSF